MFSLNTLPAIGNGHGAPAPPVGNRVASAPPVGDLPNGQTSAEPVAADGAIPSALGHWPVQLRLVPPGAPFFQDADLLLVADCVPVAYADFHRRFLRGRPVVIGCPKLDDRQAALEKLTAILKTSTVRSLTVVHMEVPCCHALAQLAAAALAACGKPLPLETVVIGVRGEVGGG